MEKTHWMQSPNKNYLGHWDLPNGKDLILTIDSAKWEKVKNPITNKTEAKRVVRFKEKVKPLICNQTNAQAIVKSTGVKFMEDSGGAKIQLYVGVHKDKRTKEDVDCIRIRREAIKQDDEIKAEIKEIYDALYDTLTKEEIQSINRVLDNEEVNSYQKVFKYLKAKQ